MAVWRQHANDSSSTLWCSVPLALAQDSSSAKENHPPILMAKSNAPSKIQILPLLCQIWINHFLCEPERRTLYHRGAQSIRNVRGQRLLRMAWGCLCYELTPLVEGLGDHEEGQFYLTPPWLSLGILTVCPVLAFSQRHISHQLMKTFLHVCPPAPPFPLFS